ncbi:MAG TPA: protein containing YHS domain protein, partial [Blastocatellia bacterium]|nr:protein containing YHS domain protein [Blastocatellia bacterium]
LGRAIAERQLVLVTGATTGLPDMVSRAAAAHGALTLGISPASNREEHADLGLPDDGAQVIVYTGFGFKGRNVINVRASDIVIIFGGGMGTLNEFTIAFDEGKVIGVLKGTGGIADHIDEIIEFAKKRSSSRVVVNEGPEQLLEACLEAYTDALD